MLLLCLMPASSTHLQVCVASTAPELYLMFTSKHSEAAVTRWVAAERSSNKAVLEPLMLGTHWTSPA